MKSKKELIKKVDIYLPQIFYFVDQLDEDSLIVQKYKPTKNNDKPTVSKKYRSKRFMTGTFHKRILNI